jgi:ribosomal protein S18 acetylase RimI-like enzyme
VLPLKTRASPRKGEALSFNSTMTRLLTKFRFKESDLQLPEILGFDCGPERWNREVATWIKSPDGDNSVLLDMKQWSIEVWLYRTEDGQLVGFASLGKNQWSLPPPKGPKHWINYIPYIGVQKKFQGEPTDAARDDKFAYQILDDLIEYAATKTDVEPYIGLSVDRENRRAIRFYENRDFVDAKTPRKEKATGVIYDRMLLGITKLVPRPGPVGPA